MVVEELDVGIIDFDVVGSFFFEVFFMMEGSEVLVFGNDDFLVIGEFVLRVVESFESEVMV